MNSDDNANIALYTALYGQHGCDPKTLNWGSARSQELRFRVMAAVAPLQGAQILDVGCGLGDFFLWLEREGISVEYTGIDLTPDIATAAAARLPKANIKNTTVLDLVKTGERFDYVFSSGIFYLRQEAPMEYLQHSVTAMFQLCRKAVAFNSLSSWLPVREGTEFYADPLETVNFCRTTLTPKVTLRHEYHPGDFTVYLYREPCA